MRRDPRLRQAMLVHGPCEIEKRGDPYRALLRSVIYQQLAGAAASAIAGRLRALYRGRLPRPDALLETSDASLRDVGLSRQKIATLREIAKAFDEGRLCNRRLRRMTDDAVVEAVTQVKGVGEWTAHMLLISSLGRMDVLPVGDYGIRKGAMRLYDLDELPKAPRLEVLCEAWRPYRTIGSWYLWRVADAE
jgi:DNA-3-methyladenine glycosylase II